MCGGGGRKPSEQEIIIAGILSKSHILGLLKNFVIYETDNNRTIKKPLRILYRPHVSICY
ncbi:MAG TPA: hypothetical protein VI278_10130 [Nitrososphaeraceae archaeon]